MIMKKHQPLLELGTQLSIQNGDISEENIILKITGTAKTSYEKNIIWDKIKAIEGKTLQISKPI